MREIQAFQNSVCIYGYNFGQKQHLPKQWKYYFNCGFFCSSPLISDKTFIGDVFWNRSNWCRSMEFWNTYFVLFWGRRHGFVPEQSDLSVMRLFPVMVVGALVQIRVRSCLWIHFVFIIVVHFSNYKHWSGKEDKGVMWLVLR